MIFPLPVCFHFSEHPDLSCGIFMLDDVKTLLQRVGYQNQLPLMLILCRGGKSMKINADSFLKMAV